MDQIENEEITLGIILTRCIVTTAILCHCYVTRCQRDTL